MSWQTVTFGGSHRRSVGAIKGQVIDAITKSPVPNATILLALDPNGSTAERGHTDSNGHFSIDSVDRGLYRLVASASGYGPQAYGARGPEEVGSEISVGSDKDSEILVELMPAGEVKGVVADQEGKPVAGIMVELLARRPYRGSVDFVPLGWRTTLSDGVYRFTSVSPRDYYVRLQYWPLEISRTSFTASETCLPNVVYYPGTPEASAALSTQVWPGRESDLGTMRLRPGACSTVRVKITSSGVLPSSLQIGLLPLEASAIQSRTTRTIHTAQEDNTFFLGHVARGDYLLTVEDTAGKSSPQVRKVAVHDEEVTETIALGGGEILGNVNGPERDGNDSRSGEWLKEVELQSVVLLNWKLVSAVGPDGTFKFSDIGEGTFHLSFGRLPSHTVVSQILVHGLARPDQRFYHAGTSDTRMSVIVQNATSSVTGVIDDDHAQPGRMIPVILVPDVVDARTPDRIMITVASGERLFAFDSVPPGRYRLLAVDNLKWSDGINPEVLSKFESGGIAVEVQEHSTISVRTKLIHAR